MIEMVRIRSKIGLALSGGGYRATLFALGALWRLNELGYLPKLTRITSVSGGSIVSALLAQHWHELLFDTETAVASNFNEVVARRVQAFCSKGLDVVATMRGLFSFRDTVADKIVKAFDKRLFHGLKIAELPFGKNIPEFIFYATNYQTGSSVQMTREFLYDYKLGRADNPDLRLAQVVGASSAFPPILSPLIWDSSDYKWVDTQYTIEAYTNLRKKLILTDGALYDNLGVEALWDGSLDQVIVCDSSAPLKIPYKMKSNWGSEALRMVNIMIDQQRALRKRRLIDEYQRKIYTGTYFGIATEIDNYELSNSLVKDNGLTHSLQHIPTRFNKFKPDRQGYLINWGYALCDAAMQRWVLTNQAVSPADWPKAYYPL